MRADFCNRQEAQRPQTWRYFVLCLLIGVSCCTCTPTPLPPTPTPPKPIDPFHKTLFRIGFGSCNFQFRDQPHWAPILAREPNLWLWAGDAIYADTLHIERMKGEYTLQLANKGYQKLRATTPIIGVWDDHDYGFNDVGASYPHKVQSQVHFLDFIDEPKASPRRKQEGIYATYLYSVESVQLRIILLDVRYHKGPKGEDILGEAQWQWYESTLAKSKAAIHLIVSPTQVLRDDTNKDTWAEYPTSRKRLFSLLHKYKTPGVVLLSGDIHVGEISRSHNTGVSYPIYELTSSGLTHTTTDYALDNTHRLAIFREKNFGMLDFTREAGKLTLHFQLYDIQGVLRAQQAIPLASLQPKR